MLKDAETFKEQDRIDKAKIDAKNSFESYIYSMRNTIEDSEKLKDKLDEEDIDTIQDALQDAKDWLENNSDAEKEDFEEQLQLLEE